jgi:hypothetical protein
MVAGGQGARHRLGRLLRGTIRGAATLLATLLALEAVLQLAG